MSQVIKNIEAVRLNPGNDTGQEAQNENTGKHEIIRGADEPG